MPTGGDPVYLDYDGNQRIGVSIAAAKINLFTFIYLEGSFAFEKGPTYMVNVATGIPANLGAALGTIGLDSLASAIGSVADIEIGENFSSINNLEVDSFTIGASNVNAFVGFGIPDLPLEVLPSLSVRTIRALTIKTYSDSYFKTSI